MTQTFTFTDQEFRHLISVIRLDSLKGDIQSVNLYRKLLLQYAGSNSRQYAAAREVYE